MIYTFPERPLPVPHPFHTAEFPPNIQSKPTLLTSDPATPRTCWTDRSQKPQTHNPRASLPHPTPSPPGGRSVRAKRALPRPFPVPPERGGPGAPRGFPVGSPRVPGSCSRSARSRTTAPGCPRERGRGGPGAELRLRQRHRGDTARAPGTRPGLRGGGVLPQPDREVPA